MGKEPNLINIRDFLEVSNEPDLLGDDLVANYHRNHPRYLFLKSVNGSILDIGCGEGGLGNYLTWPDMLLSVALHGCDLDAKEKFPPGYACYTPGGFEMIKTFNDVDAIIAIQLIEHLPNLSLFYSFLGQAKSGTRLYLEWPSIESCNFPTASKIHESFEIGSLIMTSNYLDDETHLPPQPPHPQEVQEALTQFGYRIQTSTRFHRDCDEGYRSTMIQQRDSGGLTMAYWENFGFAHVITAIKS
jgi:hypothetical protein